MITIEDRAVRVDGRTIELEHGVEQAIEVDDLILVLYRPTDLHRPSGSFRNLEAYTRRGERVWTAELPTTSSDAYYRIVGSDPVTALSRTSFRCVIDRETGRIVEKEFYR